MKIQVDVEGVKVVESPDGSSPARVHYQECGIQMDVLEWPDGDISMSYEGRVIHLRKEDRTKLKEVL